MICRIVKTYSDTLFRISFFYTHNTSDAEDITQDTFLTIIKKRPVIKDEEHLKALLIRIAINKCKDLLKSAARRKNVSIEAAIAKYKLDDDDLGILDCISTLPPLERKIVILHYIEGFTLKEVANIIGKKEGAVTMRLKRTRTKLKNLLED